MSCCPNNGGFHICLDGSSTNWLPYVAVEVEESTICYQDNGMNWRCGVAKGKRPGSMSGWLPTGSPA